MKNVLLMSLSVCITIMLLTGCFNMNDEYSTIREAPSETTTMIITKHYRPFLLDGKWVCREEIANYDYRPDSVYYDKFKNIILRLSEYGVEKILYYDASEHKISHVLTITTWGEKGRVEYIKDPQGRLLEIKHHGEPVYGVPDPKINKYNDKGVLIESIDGGTVYKYDDEGKLIERIDGHGRMTVNRPPRENENVYLATYQITREGSKYTHNSIKGLVEEGIEIYDSKTDLLQRKITKEYQYGVLQSEVDATAFYDNHNRRIKEVSQNKKTTGHGFFQRKVNVNVQKPWM